MKDYPKYRIKITLDDEFTEEFQPQVREYLLTGWDNIDGTPKEKGKMTTSTDDIHSVVIARSRFNYSPFSTELGAKMVIKYYHQELKRLEKLTEENKDKKKVRYLTINHNTL